MEERLLLGVRAVRIKLNVFFILFLFASYFTGWLKQSLILFISVVFHEFGHVLAAKKLRINVYEIELMPYGGVSRMEDLSKFGGAKEAAVSAAGPAASLALALACSLFRDFGEVFNFGLRYNLIICIFNLIPVIPLDGGKIARNLFIFFMGYKQATKVLALAGKTAAAVLLAWNIYMFAAGSRSAALIITAVFIYIGAVKEEKLSSYYFLFTRNNTKNTLAAKGRIRTRFVKAREDTPIRLVMNRLSPVTLCFVEVVDVSGETIKILNEDNIVEGFLKYGFDGKIGQIINI